MRPAHPQQDGFTLFEVLLVLVIISILSGIVLLQFRDFSERSQNAALQSTLYSVRSYLRHQQLDNGSFPSSISGSAMGGSLTNPYKPDAVDVVEVITHPTTLYPLQKRANGGHDPFFYNTTTGSFMARVPPGVGNAELIELFNEVNGTQITNQNQTR